MKKQIVILAMVFICSVAAQSQALVYKPINPAFGGETFNYQWLMSSAENQNKFTEKITAGAEKTELQRFKESLDAQLLSQISSLLYRQQFGTDGLAQGSYTFGSYSIDIYPTADGLSLNILDTKTGEKTQVIIPNK
ncbi:MAG: curli assembly protein CsgF [Flavobacteriaceae bacterium]|jgi:curli production assembly/transport component CsgF|uniref:Curli production assembly/transport component CsgF n=1 Tax=Flavobacterium kayseriense TaxID=2764714 RepID=A0ABR7J7G1_9FLAO|nr:curli production assembly/transport component CsgF [Flavobacterium kayseriense]MBC5841147.1 curli assembly protein CsgF [Flavobacterium kayseriense]MBC5847675.1 curli assembly protein CsgF [Flavobacterium kayseriense]MBU0940409.1 curli assembly protein CsgF [Bacteroidota bacterium]MBX9887606.1 curli assembly protein CsgF [Flavobacteriaceae bacterium]